MKKQITILLTNDDGFYADGILALYNELKDNYRVLMVAPESEKSGFSHKLTLKTPLHLSKINKPEATGVIINGTPVDCVKLALLNLYQNQIDLVISGINRGSNNGISVHYSGTVAAVIESAFYKIPGLAVSLYDYTDNKFNEAAKFINNFLKEHLNTIILKKSVLNINIPLEVDYTKKPVFCRMGQAVFSENYHNYNHLGRDFYWAGGPDKNIDTHGDDDDRFVLENMITVTPLQFDLTDYDGLKYWQNKNPNK